MRMIKVCPNCSSSKIHRIRKLKGYRCDACKSVFKIPKEREAKRDGFTTICKNNMSKVCS